MVPPSARRIIVKMAASSKRALVGAMAANLGIAATKLIVGLITRSTAMIAEAIHSVVDTGNAGLMLLGESRSRRPADRHHPFGHGMEIYFWSVVVAMVVFAGGGGLSAYEGIRALFHPRHITAVWPSYVVIAAAFVFETASLVIGMRELTTFRRERNLSGSTIAVIHASKNPAIFMTVLEDVAALIGLVLAAAGVTLSYYLGWHACEGIASIAIGLVLVAEAAILAYETRSLIVGEAAHERVTCAIDEIARRHPELGPLLAVTTLQLGPDAILLVLRVRFPDAMRVAQLEELGEAFESDLRRAQPSIRHVVFDISPEPSTWRCAP